MSEPRTVTALLRAWKAGDTAALEQLVPLIYDELHRIASNQLRRERPDHTFRPTDLVGEAYLRLTSGLAPTVTDRMHFFAVAARTMRNVLLDHARQRKADKRGGGVRAIELEEGLVSIERPVELIELDDALAALEKLDERKARTIELHYFAGLTQPEIADLLDVHPNTVGRDLKLGQAWLYHHIKGAS